MSGDVDLPDWARRMADPPTVTRYCGPADMAVEYRGALCRTRFAVFTSAQNMLDINIQQAAAIAEMIGHAT